MRVRTVPSMTVSPMVATTPPSTDGSTMTFMLICLPVALVSAAARRCCWSSVSGTATRTLATSRSLARDGPVDEAVDDRRQVAGPAGADDHRDELGGGVRRLAAEQVLDDRLAALGRDLLVGQRAAQRIARLVAAGEAEQLVLDLVEGALGAGDLEQAPGVAVDALSLMTALLQVRRADPADEVLDQPLVGGVVERAGDHLVDGGDRQAGDLGAQLVADAAAGGGDVGDRLGLEVGDLGLDARPAVGEHATRPAPGPRP